MGHFDGSGEAELFMNLVFSHEDQTPEEALIAYVTAENELFSAYWKAENNWSQRHSITARLNDLRMQNPDLAEEARKIREAETKRILEEQRSLGMISSRFMRES